MHGLMLAGVELDRKVLADIAVRDADTFRRFVEVSREASASAAASEPAREASAA
jgi:large subunit ribosomal protein L20